MTPREKLQEIIDEYLESYGAASKHEVFCHCYGYREFEGKVLRFSVRERCLLQTRNYDEAEALLERVVAEADEEHQRREELEAQNNKGQKRRVARLKELEHVEPPKQRSVSVPNPQNDVLGRLAASEAFAEIQRSLLPTGIASQVMEFHAATRDVRTIAGVSTLSPIFQSLIEKELPGHTYWDVNEKLEERLLRYPKVVWTKIKVERESVKDEEIDRIVRRQRASVRRTLASLLAKGALLKDDEGYYSKPK